MPAAPLVPVARPSESATPAERPPRTQAGLASSLRIAIGRLNRRLRSEREEGRTLNQLSTLGTLERHGPLPVGELAAHERVRPPSMTRTVGALEEAGLVAREPHQADRRIIVVRITDEGRAVTAADRKRRDAWLNHRLRELTPDERARLLDVLPILDKLARS
jgi:DNA-binding MarR family transcriptional regulator